MYKTGSLVDVVDIGTAMVTKSGEHVTMVKASGKHYKVPNYRIIGWGYHEA